MLSLVTLASDESESVHLHEETLGVNHCSVSMLLDLVKFSFGSLLDPQFTVFGFKIK